MQSKQKTMTKQTIQLFLVFLVTGFLTFGILADIFGMKTFLADIFIQLTAMF